MKKSSKVSFIYFDLGGVVINNEHTKQGLAKEFGLEEVAIQKFFDEHWREACLGTLDNKSYLARFKKVFQIQHQKEDFVDFITEYQGHYQETHDLIHDLSKEYRLGILSNAELGVVDTLLQKGKIPRVNWEVMIESAQLGMVKPEHDIYTFAQKKARVSSGEILFIDDRTENVETAIAFGWQTVLFNFYDVKESIEQIKDVLKLD